MRTEASQQAGRDSHVGQIKGWERENSYPLIPAKLKAFSFARVYFEWLPRISDLPGYVWFTPHNVHRNARTKGVQSERESKSAWRGFLTHPRTVTQSNQSAPQTRDLTCSFLQKKKNVYHSREKEFAAYIREHVSKTN